MPAPALQPPSQPGMTASLNHPGRTLSIELQCQLCQGEQPSRKNPALPPTMPRSPLHDTEQAAVSPHCGQTICCLLSALNQTTTLCLSQHSRAAALGAAWVALLGSSSAAAIRAAWFHPVPCWCPPWGMLMLLNQLGEEERQYRDGGSAPSHQDSILQSNPAVTAAPLSQGHAAFSHSRGKSRAAVLGLPSAPPHTGASAEGLH